MVFVRRMDRPNHSLYPLTQGYEGSRVFIDNARTASEVSERSGVLHAATVSRRTKYTFMNGYLV